MRTLLCGILILAARLCDAQTDTFSLIGSGIDTTFLKLDHNRQWTYNDQKCDGPKALYYTSGFSEGRLNRIIWFREGKIDSIVIYSLAHLPAYATNLSIQSKIKIDFAKNRRYYLIYSATNIPWAKYEYKIINHVELSSALSLLTIDQDIRFVDDGCQYSYHLNGKLKDAGAFVAGNKEGEWKYFDEQGQLLKIENFKNKVLISSRVPK